jgi:hypothetical protein
MRQKTRVAASIVLENVTRMDRRGIGPVYRGIISLEDLHMLLKRSVLRYAPLYQRGFKLTQEDIDEYRYKMLLPLDSPDLQINPKRSHAMAVKFLQGRLFTSHITWNARREEGAPPPKFDEATATLELQTTLTIPDTAHRHDAYRTLVRWHANRDEIPDEVDVDSRPVLKEAIEELIRDLDPATETIYVEVYSLSPEDEGRLYDEFNSDSKAPSTAIALDLNRTKTPARAFVYRLMQSTSVFSRDEIECRRNTIGSKSRKLTTNATLEAAIRPFTKRLVELEKDEDAYTDLLGFVDAFFGQWANHFKAFQPGIGADERWRFREHSFALSNIMFHPLFRMVFILWEEYRRGGVKWEHDRKWNDAIARIAGKANGTTVDVMDRKNLAWRGKILVQVLDPSGKETWSLSSTRQTREAAFQYMCDAAALKFDTHGRRRS